MPNLLKSFRPTDESTMGDVQKWRLEYQPKLPPVLKGSSQVVLGDQTTASDPSDAHALQRAFPLTFGQPLAQLTAATEPKPSKPLRVGVLFCGRQAPGGHNAVAGLLDSLKANNPKSELFGFLGGSDGLYKQEAMEITAETLSLYRNQGGYDLLGRSRDQIRSTQQVKDTKAACEALQLDGLVLIGSTNTATDAANLAEYFASTGLQTKVVGIPATIDGNLKNQFVETDVGFDTACKVYSQLISNICTDALSAEKYYYFIRLMGRSPSHITLECALQTHSNMVLLGEEIAMSKMTLFDLTTQICDAIQARAAKDKYHGVLILPEGLIDHIPEVHALLQEMNGLLRSGVKSEDISSKLSPWAAALFDFLPPFIKKQLLLARESDGSVQLSQIETEKLLALLVEEEMTRRTKAGLYKGKKKFSAICHFFGYQARCSLPSNFDCDYAYALGKVSASLLDAGLNGYMATITNLGHPVSEWRCGGVPITAMMTVKRWQRSPGSDNVGRPQVQSASVDLTGAPYQLLSQNAGSWLIDDLYRNFGPLQFEGPGSDARTITLGVEDHNYIGRIEELRRLLDQVKATVRPGCPEEVLKAALSSMSSVTQVLSVVAGPTFRGLQGL